MAERYKLYGGGGSPYSMKMRGILRYRRIPHDWILITPALREKLKHVGPPVIPILAFPDGRLQVDSTPLAWELESLHKERSLVPDDPCHAYVSNLIEDFGDEWCTKMMFHYRWDLEIDQIYSSRQIISDSQPGLRGDALEQAAEVIRERQVSRMALVGCTTQNKPVIEAGYHEVLNILDSFVTRDEFLFGSRPSLGDFGLFGQLKVLASDHTPMLIMRNRTPRVYDWVRRLDDASGIEGEWHEADFVRPEVKALLSYMGRTYLPFMHANAEARGAGRDEVTLEVDGKPWEQGVFKYQVKCYDRLRKMLPNVTGEAARRLETLLDETGCLRWLR